MSRGRIQDVPFGLSTNPEVLSHYNITINTISIFRMVDDKRQDLEITDGKAIDVAKMSRFIQINELRLVTEYNPVPCWGLCTQVYHYLSFLAGKARNKGITIMNQACGPSKPVSCLQKWILAAASEKLHKTLQRAVMG
uniref:Endoplasmic reticulum protein 27 n=1 Tax=Pelusios castaneus TaxID=367368 RepID=A0A8C8VRB9_9SAUR